MGESNSILIPMHIRGINQGNDEDVVGPSADYSKLPWISSNGKFHNKNSPPLGDTIVLPLFTNNGFKLKKGVHLHWFLPNIFTKPFANRQYIALPDYWVVARVDDKNVADLDNAYVIMTRYRSPADGAIIVNRSNIPIAFDLISDPHRQPYRYQGATIPYKEFNGSSNKADVASSILLNGEIVDPLTAMGFGDPSYFSFFPDCNVINGFYDTLDWNKSGKATKARYIVIGNVKLPDGYNHNALSDKQLLEIFRVAGLNEKSAIELFLDGSEVSLSSSAKYKIPSIAVSGYVEIDLVNPSPLPKSSGLSFTLGNTGTEALSAHLADIQSAGSKPKKTIIEELLESVKYRKQLDLNIIDIGPKFREERHKDSFMSVSSGNKIILKPTAKNKTEDNNPNQAISHQQILWDEKIIVTLNAINELLREHNQKQNNQISLRKAIYADWTKYIISKYTKSETKDQKLKSILPDIVEATKLIGDEINSLDQLAYICGSIDWHSIWQDNLYSPTQNSPSIGNFGLASLIYAELNKLHNLLLAEKLPWEIFNEHSDPYWVPVEPLVLIEGLDLKPEHVGEIDHRGAEPIVFDGIPDIVPGTFKVFGILKWFYFLGLKSKIAKLLVNFLVKTSTIVAITHFFRKKEEAGTQKETEAAIGSIIKKLQQQPASIKINDHWNPFILDWEAEYIPAFTKQDLYCKPEILKEQFALNEHYTGLTPINVAPQNPIKLSGRTWLSASIAFHQSEQLTSLFKSELGRNWEQFLANPSTLKATDFVDNKVSANRVLNIQQLLNIYNTIKGKVYLTQSLDGFNEQLRMHQTILQPQIVDPLGNTSQINFSEFINKAVGNIDRLAPVPLADFHPLRAGNLRLTKIRLIDNWGRFSDVQPCDLGTVTAPETLASVMPLPCPNEIGLPPRINQPARLSFSFLGAANIPGLADYTKKDVNIASPICGWLQTNHLDNSLMIFDEDGTAIGSLDQNMQINPPPGISLPPVISNPHLKRVISYIQSRGNIYLQNFMGATDEALQQIAPLPTGDKPSLALFAGRPMAVVRCELRFELQGLPIFDESWEALDELRKNPNFDRAAWAKNIKLPVRLGEHLQMNDGLVGFWEEMPNHGLKDDFFVSAPTAITSAYGLPANHLATSIQWLKLNQTANYTMLIDPRGQIHATSGVLPVEQIHLSPKEYTEALKKMYIWFYSGPNLAPAVLGPNKKPKSQVRMKLPKEEGWSWSWMSKDETGAWVEVAGDQLSPPVENAELDAYIDIREGWLVLKQNP